MLRMLRKINAELQICRQAKRGVSKLRCYLNDIFVEHSQIEMIQNLSAEKVTTVESGKSDT